MRRTSASLAAAASLLVMVSAAAAAGSGDYLLELGGVDGESKDDKHKEQIEIQSFSWGATQTSAGFGHGGGGGTGKVAVHDITISKMPATGAADAPTDGLMILRAKEKPAGAAGNMTLKGSKIGENAPAPGGVQVAAGDVDGDGRASGQATGKRQHLPIRARAYYDAPRAKGSVTVRGQFPGCAVGARYPSIRLGNSARRYTLQDAVITSCGTVPGAAAMEEVSFNYAKIKT